MFLLKKNLKQSTIMTYLLSPVPSQEYDIFSHSFDVFQLWILPFGWVLSFLNFPLRLFRIYFFLNIWYYIPMLKVWQGNIMFTFFIIDNVVYMNEWINNLLKCIRNWHNIITNVMIIYIFRQSHRLTKPFHFKAWLYI